MDILNIYMSKALASGSYSRLSHRPSMKVLKTESFDLDDVILLKFRPENCDAAKRFLGAKKWYFDSMIFSDFGRTTLTTRYIYIKKSSFEPILYVSTQTDNSCGRVKDCYIKLYAKSGKIKSSARPLMQNFTYRIFNEMGYGRTNLVSLNDDLTEKIYKPLGYKGRRGHGLYITKYNFKCIYMKNLRSYNKTKDIEMFDVGEKELGKLL